MKRRARRARRSQHANASSRVGSSPCLVLREFPMGHTWQRSRAAANLSPRAARAKCPTRRNAWA
eukprot:5641212-Alexandrium_andersonii.AAC.1